MRVNNSMFSAQLYPV